MCASRFGSKQRLKGLATDLTVNAYIFLFCDKTGITLKKWNFVSVYLRKKCNAAATTVALTGPQLLHRDGVAFSWPTASAAVHVLLKRPTAIATTCRRRSPVIVAKLQRDRRRRAQTLAGWRGRTLEARGSNCFAARSLVYRQCAVHRDRQPKHEVMCHCSETKQRRQVGGIVNVNKNLDCGNMKILRQGYSPTMYFDWRVIAHTQQLRKYA